MLNTIWSVLFDVRYGLGGGGGGGKGDGDICAPPLISKSTNSILMTIYSALYKNCSRYITEICFKIGLGSPEIMCCLYTNVVFYT